MMWRERISYALKLAVSYALFSVGLLQLWKAIVLRRRAVVLMYHRVLSPVERRRTGSHPGIVVDTRTFERQMAILKQRFVVLSLDDFADRLERKRAFPHSSCLITFDDGWYDNHANAMATLNWYGFPAVVFLPIDFIGQGRLFWREALTHVLVRVVLEVRKSPVRRREFVDVLNAAGLTHILELQDEEPLPSVIQAIAARGRAVGATAENLLEPLATLLGVRIDQLSTTDRFLGWDDIRTMSKKGIVFGGHGAAHRVLTEVSADEAQSEIRSSKDVIDRQLGEKLPVFSYPNGGWSPQIAEMVRTCSYRLAFTTEPGFVSCNDDRFALRRVNIHEGVTGTTPMFLARLLGLF